MIETVTEGREFEKEGENGISYDEFLSHAGELGKYQILLFISLSPFYFFGAFSYFSQLFMTEVAPNHWCRIPELENLTSVERRNLAIPKDDTAPFGYSHCKAYVANWTEVLSTGATPDHSSNTQPCQYGWEFNTTEIPYPTISSEMEWVCDKSSYQATAQSLFFIGSIVGGFFVGWVSDRFGRLWAAAFSNIIGCIAGVTTIFVKNFILFAVCRFFMGMSYDNCMIMAYLLLVEYIAPKYRSILANTSFALFFTTGISILPWISLASGHWTTISLVTSVPMAFALLAPFVLPESPRWLLSKGRIDEAVNKVVAIGKVNKKEISLKTIEQFKKYTSRNKQERRGSIFDILRSPLLRNMFLCSCIVYMGCMMTFDALVRSVGQLQFDFFVSFTLISLTEFPSLIIVGFIMDGTGRLWLEIITLMSCCIFTLLTIFVPSGLPSLLCAVTARFFINMSCNTIMQWATEVLPTPVRGTGMSVVHICGYVGTVISPFIVYLEYYVTWLPLVVTACVAALSAVVSLGIPETCGKALPQTFHDAEDLVRNKKFFEIPFLTKSKMRSSTNGQVSK